MTRPEYEVVQYDPTLLDGVLRLQKHLWGRDELCNRRYFAWKYEENPCVEKPLIYLALHRHDVVAMRGMYSVRWEMGGDGRTVAGVCAGDTVIAPEHRGRGLFRLINNTALPDLKRRGYEYALALSTGRTTRLLTLRSGGRRLAPYGTMGRYAVPWRHPSVTKLLRSPRIAKGASRLHAVLSRYQRRPADGSVTASPFRALDRAAEKRGRISSGHLTIGKEPRPQDMADLAQACRKTDHIHQAESPEYFAWRFRNPRSAYRFVYWDDAGLEAYLVLEASKVGLSKTVHLVDWQCRDAEIAYRMLRAALTGGRFPAVETWSLSLEPTIKTALIRAGFRRVDMTDTKSYPAPGPLIIKTSRTEYDQECDRDGVNVMDPASWAFRMIWSDSH